MFKQLIVRVYDFNQKVVKYNKLVASTKIQKMQDFSNNVSRTNGRWTKQQHLKFLEGLRIYGKNWKKIEQLVLTRNGSQIRSHAQKFFLKVKEVQNIKEKEDSNQSGDLQEQPEQMTLISKSTSESRIFREGLSFYLGRIMECSGGQTDFDFWKSLVDYRANTIKIEAPIKNSSFISYKNKINSGDFISNHEKLMIA